MDCPEGSPVALITGAGSGIGRASALLLAREGYRVALVGRSIAKLERVADEIQNAAEPVSAPGPPLVIAANLATAGSCEAAVSSVVGSLGRLDALINNAGWSPLAALADVDGDTALRIFEINALVPIWTTHAAWAHFARQHAAGPAGASACIVNVSSMASVDPFPGLGVYGAAKAAVNTLTRATASEGREIGLRAFAVAPGAVETDLLRSLFPVEQLPPERCLKPEDVARVILDCVRGAHDSQNGETIFLPSP